MGKTKISATARAEYELAMANRDRCKELLKENGVPGVEEFTKQVEALHKGESMLPSFNVQLQAIARNIGFLEGIIGGMLQADRRSKQDELEKSLKTKKKKRSIHQGL